MTTSKFSDAALELTAAAEGALEISVQGAKLIVEDASNYEVHWTAKQEGGDMYKIYDTYIRLKVLLKQARPWWKWSDVTQKKQPEDIGFTRKYR